MSQVVTVEDPRDAREPRDSRNTQALERVKDLTEGRIRTAIGKVPPEVMSDAAREFAVEVVGTSRQALLRSAG